MTMSGVLQLFRLNVFPYVVLRESRIRTGTVEDIEAACWQLLEDCGGKKVLTGSTSEIHPEISVENAMTMYNIFRNYHDPAFVAAHKKKTSLK